MYMYTYISISKYVKIYKSIYVCICINYSYISANM